MAHTTRNIAALIIAARNALAVLDHAHAAWPGIVQPERTALAAALAALDAPERTEQQTALDLD